MITVGITGGIGSGKSTVASYIRSMGYPVIDADSIARKVLDSHTEVLEYIKKTHGKDLFQNGVLNRRRFADVVFKDPLKLKEYLNVIMPLIIKDIKDEFQELESKGYELAFVDAPLLFEERDRLKVDISVVVDVEPEIQIARVQSRDGLSKDEIKKRMKNQLSREEKIQLSDIVIKNHGSKEELLQKTKALVSDLLRRTDEKKKQDLK